MLSRVATPLCAGSQVPQHGVVLQEMRQEVSSYLVHWAGELYLFRGEDCQGCSHPSHSCFLLYFLFPGGFLPIVLYSDF